MGSWKRRLVGALFVGLLALSPILAMRTAEFWNGWKDSDHNGMQDPFENGGYDWFDINGMEAVITWLVLVVLIVFIGITLDYVLLRRESRKR